MGRRPDLLRGTNSSPVRLPALEPRFDGILPFAA